MAEQKSLGEFDGFPIERVAMEIRALGGGLRDAVKVSDVEFHRGVPHYVVLKVAPDAFKLNPTFHLDAQGNKTLEQSGWESVAVMDLAGVAFLSEEAARDALAETARLIEARRVEDEAAKGIHAIPFDEAAAAEAAAAAAGSSKDHEAAVADIATRRATKGTAKKAVAKKGTDADK